MKRILITLLLLLTSAQVMAAQTMTPEQEQRAQKMVYDFLFNDPDSPRIGAKDPKLTLGGLYGLQLPVLQEIRSLHGKDRRKTPGCGGGI